MCTHYWLSYNTTHHYTQYNTHISNTYKHNNNNPTTNNEHKPCHHNTQLTTCQLDYTHHPYFTQMSNHGVTQYVHDVHTYTLIELTSCICMTVSCIHAHVCIHQTHEIILVDASHTTTHIKTTHECIQPCLYMFVNMFNTNNCMLQLHTIVFSHNTPTTQLNN